MPTPWWQWLIGAGLLTAGAVAVPACGAAPFALFDRQTAVSLETSDPSLESVYDGFDPALRAYLRSVPIVTSSRAQTSYSVYRGDGAAFIALSPDFFKTAAESRYWRSTYSKPPYNLQPDEPAFGEEFRRQLLVHELVHIAQAHLKRDAAAFFADVAEWYRDETAGRPAPGGTGTAVNRTKYILWWNVYGQAGVPDDPSDRAWQRMDYCQRYRGLPPGVEEYAYIGDTILCPADARISQARLDEISDAIAEAYRGVISPEVLALRQCRQ